MKHPIVSKPCPDCEGTGILSAVASWFDGVPHTWDYADCGACAGVGQIVGKADCAHCADKGRLSVEASPYVDSLGGIVVPEVEIPCPHCLPKTTKRKAAGADHGAA